ncbi:mutagen-sensitive 312 [Aphomia sociella]
MDESFSDFKQKKKNCIGPKNTQKSTKSKVKKVSKRIKGQKDIRAVLNPKKNELVSYSKDFDNVCKQSGIDVDPEQLQLAVALSKSLQPADTNDSSKSQTCTQERTDKIRTTLLEYGFVVPEIKITNLSKRLKKCNKNYKLLLCSDAEKQQLIADKYSQLLFDNIDNLNNCSYDLCNGYSDTHLFYLTTNAVYDDLRNNDTFYVSDLPLKKLSHKGSLLREWSKIPGRLTSPKICKYIKMDISEITCSQDELDVILSGTFKCARNVFRSKTGKASPIINNIVENDTNTVTTNTDIKIIDDNLHIETNQANTVSDVENIKFSVSSAPVRSCSPDLFEDEASSFLLDSNDTTILKSPCRTITNIEDVIEIVEYPDNIVNTERTLNHVVTNCTSNTQLSQISNDPMELTECVILQYEHIVHKNVTHTQLSSETDVTKRKSDDFMDLTECIVQKQNPTQYEIEINLTQNTDENNDKVDLEIKESDDLNHVDLTQSSNSSNDLPFVQISGSINKSLDETVILNDSEINMTLSNKHKSVTTEAINSNEETIRLNNKTPIEVNDNLANVSFFDDFLHNHSDDDIEGNFDIQSDGHTVKNDKNIDLIQSSDSEETITNVDQSSHEKVNIENNPEISIDYDDVCFDNYMHVNQNNSITKDSSLRNTDVCDLSKSPEKNSTHTSHNSEVFEISDKELDYSLHKSGYDEQIEINYGSISTMDFQSSNIQSCSFVNNDQSLGMTVLKNSMSDSYLPVVDIKKTHSTETAPCSSKVATPHKEENIATIQTPNNKEYIVKTHQVTPILDYASMTTPERNKELNKYGLKPFKRKRAIQLLTHIYNQTHPVVVPCTNEDILSPSKKCKTSKSPKSTSPRKSPRKPASAHIEFAKENIYEITNDLPDLKEIDCSADDWVFQKKEKAKVCSCRVPLHVAFHNLVSCRRRLREAILRYEPVNIDIIYKELVACGYRYDPKDLLKFMDKKCITVKTSDNNSRNNKK